MLQTRALHFSIHILCQKPLHQCHPTFFRPLTYLAIHLPLSSDLQTPHAATHSHPLTPTHSWTLSLSLIPALQPSRSQSQTHPTSI
ncbi:hypothetical protein BDV95DRAFT_565535 [Massariosphaeria phaeospora]|uniref:Uncharacterized protein n=1 Tax=Massariosphaeria phaeospora TaxID=100035 RepID=A0A7C8I9N3_9PLEO|nr:hypothetical protein BDV95DRAFT_565535 [Massariosphaeria phaeospora]